MPVRKPILTPNQIKSMRELLGITERELAQRLGVSIGTMRNYESGFTVMTRTNQRSLERMVHSRKHEILEAVNAQEN